MRRPHIFSISITLVTALLIITSPATAQEDTGLGLLEAELNRLAYLSGGTVGVGAVHVETGREVYLNADIPFPMASTYKVPIAVQLLTMVDRGEMSLDRMVELEEGDLHPGSGTLSELFNDPGVILSLRNYLELMLLISDNSATDIVLRLAGGGAAVTSRMQELGITGINVDRPTLELIGDWIGVRGLPEDGKVSPTQFREFTSDVSAEAREKAAEDFDSDPRDTATPRGMTTLLTRLWNGELLSDGGSELLIDIMHRCSTGDARIKGILPPATQVYHKTGTIGGTTNDVGIIKLPNNAGHVAVSIFIKESRRDVERRELTIAHISRAIYDYFVFTPRGLSEQSPTGS